MSFKRRKGDRDGAISGLVPERAIIDIGSNTVRLVVYGGTMRAPTVLLNEKVTAKLGRDIGRTGALADEAVDLAMRGLKRFVLILDDLGLDDVETVATAAVRDATNGCEFVAGLEKLGLSPRILSGEEEGRLGAQGVLGAFPSANGIVADLGGGSLELTTISDGVPQSASTLPLGTLRLPDYRKDSISDMLATLEKKLAKAGWGKAGDDKKVLHDDNPPLYLVGGTWRTMAVYAMQEQGYPLSDPHGLSATLKDTESWAKALSKENKDDLKARDRISTMRAEKLPDAAVLLRALLARLKPKRVHFSSWGLREGLLFDRLPPEGKSQDPLLAGISVFASQRGAPPMLATQMAGWTVDATRGEGRGSERLRLAATMLALASMQIEPNIRLPQAIDWALHKRWIAIDGEGRAMLAAAIAANGNHMDLPEEVHALASEKAIEEAIRWGLAIRLARRLGARSRKSLQVSRLRVAGGDLVLRLGESHQDLFGIPTEKDMKLLAGRLGLDWRVEIVADDALDQDTTQ